MLSAMPRSMECSFLFLWALEWKNWFSINPGPDYKKGKPCLLLIWFGILRPHRLDSVPSYTFYPTSYHSESHSITLVTLVVLLVELKDWISLSVPTRHPCLRVIQYQWPNKEVASWKISLPSLYLIWSGKNPSRFKNSPNWDIHSEPDYITNEKRRC